MNDNVERKLTDLISMKIVEVWWLILEFGKRKPEGEVIWKIFEAFLFVIGSINYGQPSETYCKGSFCLLYLTDDMVEE